MLKKCTHLLELQWFDMARFWPSAARILRPGGTVAIWGTKSQSAHKSVPNADKINAALEDLEQKELRPYFEPGNLIAHSLYKDLGLPWTVQPPVPDFDEATSYRKLFGTEDDIKDTPILANQKALVFNCECPF